MIVVKIELWPKGEEKRAKELGRTYIYNKGDGTAAKGNYEVRVCRKGSFHKTGREIVAAKGFTRTGKVLGWPRLTQNIWRLAIRSLLACFPEEAP